MNDQNRAIGMTRSLGNTQGMGSSVGGGNNYNNERFNSVRDRLDQGSVVEDMIPRQPTQLHMMLRRIYLRCAISGTVVDIFSTLPWGKIYELIGIDDPKVLQMFHDMIEGINIWGELPMICREYQIIGRVISSLSFNERLGRWDAIIPIDPDQAKITPLPMSGHKPLIDVLPSPAWREFARSTDPRVVDMKERMNPALIEMLGQQSGYIPLDPLNTLWLARRVNQYDHIGTSLFARILPAWAYEVALWNASLTGVRRRNRSILMVTAGIADSWEPTDDEIASISSLFMSADEDPTGAVIATRYGVEVSEVRDPSAIWGISQEFDFLSTIKMRSLGISEAYLSGETNVSNMESARTALGKQIAAFRDYIIREIFQKQLFPTFARIHNIQRRTQAELAHGIRTSGVTRITSRAAMDIPDDALLIPQLITEDTLRPVEDMQYIELLKAIKDEGVPVPLRIWASAAGYDLDKAMAMMDENSKLKSRISQMTGEGGSPEGASEDLGQGDSAADMFGGEEDQAGNGSGATVPPKWGTVQSSASRHAMPFQTPAMIKGKAFDEDIISRFNDRMKSSSAFKVMSKIEPRLLAELSIPNERSLVPYDYVTEPSKTIKPR